MAYPISLSILGGTTIYLCDIVIPYVKSTIGFLGIICWWLLLLLLLFYFFTVFFVLMRRGRQFRKMNNDIVREYHEK